jgi:alkylhydroperoxidase family enzyme
MPRIILPDVKDLGAAAGALRPEMYAGFRAFSRAVYSSSQLPQREFEAARFRVALVNGCARCQALRLARDLPGRADRAEELPESFYEALGEWRDAPIFTERERLAIEFAERFATDHRALAEDDGFWDRMYDAFEDAEIVDLSLSVASFLGGGRFHHVLGTDAVCPVSQDLLEQAVGR